MAKAKKLKTNDRRLNRSQSIPEKVQAAVKRAVINATRVGFPASVQTTDQQRQFRKVLTKYSIMNKTVDQQAELRHVSEQVGIGVFALKSIQAGTIFDTDKMWGNMGRIIHEGDAKNKRSSILDDSHDRPVFRLLNGPISFVNHACEQHANCITQFAGVDEKDDFKVLQAIKPIKKNEELSIMYSYDSLLSCKLCIK